MSPAKYFKCPNNEGKDGIVEISRCLEFCTSPTGRCLSLPTLYAIGEQRPWNGKPSTTMLINPTRMEYLKIRCNYVINPFDSAFMLLGTRVHKRLEIVAKKLDLITEKFMPDDETNSTLDLIEPDELYQGCYKLVDLKTWGSFAVAKALGIKKFDSDPEIKDSEWQLNHYRIKIEKLGFNISRLFIQAIIRDGGTYTSKNNGIEQKFVMIPINKLPDIDVTTFFTTRACKLIHHLDTHSLPEMCSYQENWGNRRCKGFCNVAEFCPEGAMLNKIEQKEIPNDHT